MATWLGCHRRAFEWFDGVPERVIIDNAKCAIVKACAHDPLVQRAYAECAEGYGFKIDACPPQDPQKKGIVESGVKYVKGNFLPTRDLPRPGRPERTGAAVGDARSRRARARHHARAAAGRCSRWSGPCCAALPASRRTWAPGTAWCCTATAMFSTTRAFYSAPFTLVGKTLWLRATDTAVALYEDYRHVATHLRAPAGRPARDACATTCRPRRAAFFERDRRWCTTQAQTVGPRCAELIDRLLGDRIAERLRAAQGVLALGKRYGSGAAGGRVRHGRWRTTARTTAPSRRSWPPAPTSSR